MNNKIILVGLLIVLVSFGLCGCGITNSTAKKAAKEYIEDKYGQDSKVVKVSKNTNSQDRAVACYRMELRQMKVIISSWKWAVADLMFA